MWRREHTSKFPYGIYWRTLKNLKNQNFEKIGKKLLEISSFYTCVPKTTIIWGMIPEIRCEADEDFCHFGPFFALLPPPPPPLPLTTWKIKILKKWKKHLERSPWSYDVWFLRYKVRQTEAFVILGHFLPFDPTNNLKNQNFEKMKKKNKKTWRYYHFTLVYHKWWS